MKKPANFVMAGGGTGGHVIPALAVANELRARGHAVRFIGTRRGIEAKLVPTAGFPIDWIEIGGLNRVGMRQTMMSLAELPWSVFEAARALDRARPVTAVFSTGGYVAGPVLIAALWKRLPVVVMEPNAIPGFTHRKLARFVAKALVSFEETLRYFPKGRAEVTGRPVASEFFAIAPKPRADVLTVLLTGGSQGSRTLNRAAEESWPLWERDSVRLIHQTGERAFADLAPKFQASGMPGEISAFLENMPQAFAEADLIVSRSGGTVSEIAAAGKPSILVPLPTAADQHQLRNAQAFEKVGAARLVVDSEMTGVRLVEEVTRLASEPEVLQKMGEAARALARPGAAQRAADVLEGLI
ncbi:MAG TPA: undecaprenyldiphospho-muramoylpentapeptide beta-N-acetylglucosaminyltransferase [Bryobacteraceae bacterium]|jgi:UDP-N-acetylglucosamine--N-acetylmuramyl-(pentapeptide) pyrophosphoryl-undecaprenol N-acetylglucosamine transferase|nr:undecaprenyldiphospho-muramoylpentapeptide beta-N-acetylglucosaminyltransferase [Bryobacteraceae bacterium]